ncbi:MAG TPA: hypothetical protein G4N94_02420 [Caldilineae bacterium]|nr:hypothetical protein [Caldilineae bacterium]
MIQRRTQNLAYWREQYKVDEADHEFLYDLLGGAAEPMSLEALAVAVIDRRCQTEESRIRNELSRGRIYDPQEAYEVGDAVVFPAFEYRFGEVIGLRPGENPEHGEFDVLTVRFEDDGRERMFAGRLKTPHILNREGDELTFSDEPLLSAQDIYDEVGDVLTEAFEKHLRDNPDYFINAGPKWLTTDQMAPVNVGHLNIAEAAIEMKGEPTSTSELLDMVEIDPTLSESVRVFSLETAMHSDGRFVQVGPAGASAWVLRTMLPDAALSIPLSLRYKPVSYDRSELTVELLQTEWEIADEWSEDGVMESAPAQVPSVVVHPIFPHMVSGVLPLNAAARSLFPQGDGVCTAVTLIDGRWGKRFPGWVMHEGRYLAGLDKWRQEHKLPIGATITLAHTNNPDEIVVDFKPQRMKREWVRTARIENDRLVFQMERRQIVCEYDDNLGLFVANPDKILAYAAFVDEQDIPVETLVEQIMPELTKLSPQGTTHIKTLYSAVNVIRRLPPGPIFAALLKIPEATDTGSGYWSL